MNSSGRWVLLFMTIECVRFRCAAGYLLAANKFMSFNRIHNARLSTICGAFYFWVFVVVVSCFYLLLRRKPLMNEVGAYFQHVYKWIPIALWMHAVLCSFLFEIGLNNNNKKRTCSRFIMDVREYSGVCTIQSITRWDLRGSFVLFFSCVIREISF